MAAMNFPSSPSNGDTYTNPDTGVTYTYDGTDAKWKTTVTSNAFLPLSGGTLTGALSVTDIKHPSSGSNNIVLDSSGGVDMDAFTVSGSAPADSVNLDASGRLLVGTSTARDVGGHGAKIQLEDTGYSATVQAVRNANDSDGAFLFLGKSRGTTLGSNTVVQSGDGLGYIRFYGADGSTMRGAAEITCYVDGTPGAADMPGRLVFSTTADGASSPTERMRIKNTGAILQTGNAASDYALTLKNQGDATNRYGIRIDCGKYDASGNNYAIEFFDGDGGFQGNITFSGGTVTYGAFTAYHPCILPEEDNETGYPYGTLLETMAIEYIEKNGVATERGIRYKVRKTQSANSKAVLGAYGSSMNNGPSGETNSHQALVLGDGHILCNGTGGNIKMGDGICSSNTAGIGQKATATPSMIIGIAQENVSFDGDEIKLVPVQYGLQQFIPWQD